jgi:C4-dicarboxylate-specific signal transduction histidine kinase
MAALALLLGLSGWYFSPHRHVESALVLTRDLTEHMLAAEALRETEAELARVNRVTTLGVLAASIAHEVNQPLFQF